MRKIIYKEIVSQVARACIEMATQITEDVSQAYCRALDRETDPIPKSIMRDLIKNADQAIKAPLPICQDTGTVVVFLEMGQGAQVEGGFVYEAIQEGVAQGFVEGHLRKSMVRDPLVRDNTGDNRPAIIHTKLFSDDRFILRLALKGGGSENMSALRMLTPAQGYVGFVDFILETVQRAGPNACPPMVIGAALGGNFESVALEAKRTLLREIGDRHPDPKMAQRELEILKKINQLDVGPQGLGGKTTAFDLHLSFLPCHIASLPAAVNINCHVGRHQTISL